MIAKNGIALLCVGWLSVLCTSSAFAQSQTTGRIAGTVKDQRGALIVGADIAVSSLATAAERQVTTDNQGNYGVPLLAPGTYHVRVSANGFASALFDSVHVLITETTLVNAELSAAGVISDPVTIQIATLIQKDGPQLGRVIDSGAVSALPLATRNCCARAGNACNVRPPWRSKLRAGSGARKTRHAVPDSLVPQAWPPTESLRNSEISNFA